MFISINTKRLLTFKPQNEIAFTMQHPKHRHKIKGN